MTKVNSTAPTHEELAKTDIFTVNVSLPPKGKLKWRGGNLALGTPVQEEVIDSDGNWLSLSLAEVLNRLDDFTGMRFNMTIQDCLIANAFDAYEYGLMSVPERGVFEAFVRNKLGTVTTIEAAKRLMFNH